MERLVSEPNFMRCREKALEKKKQTVCNEDRTSETRSRIDSQVSLENDQCWRISLDALRISLFGGSIHNNALRNRVDPLAPSRSLLLFSAFTIEIVSIRSG